MGYRKLDTKAFISEATKLHNGKYDYSLAEYEHSNIPVKIICPTHGIFEQIPRGHIRSDSPAGCRRCAYDAREIKRGSPENWYRQAITFMDKLHKDKPHIHFDLLSYRGTKNKMNYHCSIHNEGGYICAAAILKGLGCPKCSNENSLHNDDAFCKVKHAKGFIKFLAKAKTLHGDSYDYSKSIYSRSIDKILIKCNLHGTEFTQRPSAHLQGQGCPTCGLIAASINSSLGLEEFKVRFNDYNKNPLVSLVDSSYKGQEHKIEILCKIHGKSYITAGITYPHNNNSGCCIKCNRDAVRVTSLKEFINKSVEMFGDKYDYSKCTFPYYLNNRSKMKIRCKLHDYTMNLSSNRHMRGNGGCPKCARELFGRWSPKVLMKNEAYFRNEVCSVYLIRMSSLENSWFKIGISKNMISRMNALQSESKAHIDILCEVKSNTFESSEAEHHLHGIYKSKRFQHHLKFGGYTECFNLNEKDISCIKEYLFNKAFS